MKSLRFTYKTGAALSASIKILKRRAELSAGYRELIQFAAASLNTDGTHPAIEKAFFIKDNELAVIFHVSAGRSENSAVSPSAVFVMRSESGPSAVMTRLSIPGGSSPLISSATEAVPPS